jgi:hypothetical protein
MTTTTNHRVRLSKTSKMPCLSWSLEAKKTCPGSHNKDGNLVEVCQGCYAAKGFYHMPTSKKLRDYNRSDWKRDEWVDEIIAALLGQEYFRWFDSGDIYHPRLAGKIYLVMRATPNTKHWLPTRSHKVKRIKPYLTSMKRLSNVAVRYSSDRINRFNRRVHGSMVYDPTTMKGRFMGEKNLSVKACRAWTRGHKCGDCRACWDRSIKLVGYPLQ